MPVPGAIFAFTVLRRMRSIAPLALLLGLLLPAVSAAGRRAHPQHLSAAQRAIRAVLHSPELWATINVCDTPKQPGRVGVRGSMPGDGHPRDQMWMSFHLQYLNASGEWLEVEGANSSGFIKVGAADVTRQFGETFTLKPRPGKSGFQLRGEVDFRWTRDKHIVLSAHRETTADHEAEGAEPKRYSAADCTVS